MPGNREERSRSSQKNGKSRSANSNEKRSSIEDDAALARRMQQQLDDEEIAQRLSHGESQHSRRRERSDGERDHSRRREPSDRRRASVSSERRNRSSTRSSNRRRSSSEGDRPIKSSKRSSNGQRRASDNLTIDRGQPANSTNVDQEKLDEELARKLTEKETMRNLVRLKPDKITPPQRWTLRRICTLAVPLLVIVAAVIGIVFAFSGGAAAALTGLPPTLQQGDPFLGKSSTQLSHWDNGGKGGLSLEVVNALDANWESAFHLAVTDWDYGSPDALTLKITKTDPDSTCAQIQGKMKVCNGDYGDTQWLGINEVITKNGIIISSAARMNDFYLKTAIDSQRQYTMCHEIGHGFGLPHTDENFYNKDLGNCLDYTIHPWVNEHPSSMNYNVLVQMYGTVGGRRGLLRRMRRSLSQPQNVESGKHPAWVFSEFAEARERLELGGYLNADKGGWTVMHRSPFGEGHKLDLGEGYFAHVDILLVTQNFYDNGPR